MYTNLYKLNIYSINLENQAVISFIQKCFKTLIQVRSTNLVDIS